MLGYSLDEIDPHVKSWEKLVHPDDIPGVMDTLNAHLQGETSYYETEHRMITKSGQWKWILDKGKVFERDKKGNPLRAAGTHKDITERNNMEKMLIIRAEQQKVVAALGQLALTKTDLKTLLHEIVTQIAETLKVEYCKILELLPEGKSLLLYAGVGWKEGRVGAAIVGTEKDSQAGYTLLSHKPVVVKDLTKETRFSGPDLLIEHNVISGISVIIGEPEKPWGVLGVHTSQKRNFSDDDVYFIQVIANLLSSTIDHFHTNEELLRTQTLFNSALEQTPAGIIIATSRDMKIRFVNSATLEILGEKRQNLTGRIVDKCIKSSQFFHLDKTPYKAQDMPLNQAVLYRKTWKNVDIIIQRPDSEKRHVLCNAAPIYNEKDKVIAGITVFLDVTERKSLEEQLYQSQKMEAVGSLAGGIAHDFNNLLTVIIGYSDLLLMDKGLRDLLKKNIEEIHQAANRAASLVRQILAFSRKQILNPQIVNLNTIVKEMKKMLIRLIGEDIELKLILDSHLEQIKVDPVQIEQVIMNLAINSRDAMPRGGKLTIETAHIYLDKTYVKTHSEVTAGYYVMLSLSDSGCGMDQETQKRIFEPFFTTKEVGKGTGLGLATVYGIIKQSGGYIWIYSEPEKGTTFKIYFPITNEKIDEPAGDRALSNSLTGSETILVVEDEVAVQKLTSSVLKKFGYTVLEASQADEALRIFKQHKEQINLILTDVVMPGMSGLELVKRLSSQYPDIKALYMSGYPENVIAHHGILDSPIPLLQKPLTQITLLKMVRKVLDST